MQTSTLTPHTLRLGSGVLNFPTFLPDATFGYVRGLDAGDLENLGIDGLVMNSFHLMQTPGSAVVGALGGLHKMAGWRRPIVTDSGGFQAYSLIRQNPKAGSINKAGITYYPEGFSRKISLTPEKSIQLQMAYGSDVLICLDDCTDSSASYQEESESVDRTIQWARRAKQAYLRLVAERNLSDEERPRLFAVVQGGEFRDLRRACAEALLELGFDGFGFGGWPLDEAGALLTDTLGYVRELIPPQFPLHALGIGHPEAVVLAHTLGYQIFDSALPTRDARHGRLYQFREDPSNPVGPSSSPWFDTLFIQDERHMRSDEPISPYCDALCCSRYSVGYLHHLFKMGDPLYIRLATLHNLRFMVTLCNQLEQRDQG
jgi:queuine tRNA-ribosyltransferase